MLLLLVGGDFLGVFGVGGQVVEVGIDDELGLDAEVGEEGKLGDTVGFEVDFESDVLDKVGVLDGEGGVLAVVD